MRFGVGMLLIDAQHSALNMLGTDTTRADRNVMIVKKFRKGRDQYVYVSPQAWRYWWRNTLKNHFNWNLSPIFREEKQVFTAADPIQYPDDDVFGYMRAINEKKGNKKLNATVTRISPLKNTPLISLYPYRSSVTTDEGYASRHEGDPVPYSSEFYSTILKGAFSIDLDMIGRFVIVEKSGYKNLLRIDEILEDFEDIKSQYIKMRDDVINNKGKISENEWSLGKDIRKKRAIETIKALKYLFGGAKLTEYLTDVTPKFIILGMFEGGINPFISGIVSEDKGEIKLDTEAIIERVKMYKDILDPKKIFIGKDAGFMKGWNEQLNKMKETLKEDGITIEITTIGNAIDKFAKEIECYYDPSGKKCSE